MLDSFQTVLWSITYALIIVAGILSRKDKKVSMPYASGVLSFSWEICAIWGSGGFWGHVAWLALDIAIVFIGFRYLQASRSRVLYAISILISTALLQYIFTIQSGMLISAFVIDLIMAVCYLVDRKKLSSKLKIPIAFTRLLGDLFAGVFYAPESIFIVIVAVIVFFCNLSYLYLCIEETG